MGSPGLALVGIGAFGLGIVLAAFFVVPGVFIVFDAFNADDGTDAIYGPGQVSAAGFVATWLAAITVGLIFGGFSLIISAKD
jgi:hypothetical protein